MKIARVSVGGTVTYVLIEATDGVATALELVGHPFAPPQRTGQSWPLGKVKLLAPVLPSKVIAAAKNYQDHAAEMGSEPLAEPMIFLKPSTSVIGPADVILLPAQSARVDHEAELAVVIGRLCRDVSAAAASLAILGYTCANDVTARDLQARDGQWSRAKGFDTFCPLGPWIETDLDSGNGQPTDLGIECRVNGDLRQQGNTAQMVHEVGELVAYASSVMTLLPGDVILTGTPAGIGPLTDGDEVEVRIDGIGSLWNPVRQRPASA